MWNPICRPPRSEVLLDDALDPHLRRRRQLQLTCANNSSASWRHCDDESAGTEEEMADPRKSWRASLLRRFTNPNYKVAVLIFPH